MLLVSEDLDEILELSDRIVVMCDGKIVYETPGADADAHEIGRHWPGTREARVGEDWESDGASALALPAGRHTQALA